MALKAHKITINLEVKGQREPELYAGIKAIPEVCRDAVLRGLLTLAIRTPPHLVAASARNAGEMFALEQIEDCATITRKLTFHADRTEDQHLHAHLADVPVGRRQQTVRSLLMMGLLTQHAPQSEAAGLATDVTRPTANQSHVARPLFREESLATPTAVAAPVMAPVDHIKAENSLPAGPSDDLAELFSAIPMKV